MACSTSNLQFSSLVVHEAKIHDVVDNDIDVYLSPFIEDLRKLWDEGGLVFDGFQNETFLMHTMLFYTINDFPAYGHLSDYNVKGHHACPICKEDTSYIQLKHGRKIVYTRHRYFLKPHHPYRRLKKTFNGSQEHKIAPISLTGEQVLQRVEILNTIFGKTQKKEKKLDLHMEEEVDFL